MRRPSAKDGVRTRRPVSCQVSPLCSTRARSLRRAWRVCRGVAHGRLGFDALCLAPISFILELGHVASGCLPPLTPGRGGGCRFRRVQPFGRACGIRTVRLELPGGPHYSIGCSLSHQNNDDPIVFPGQPGRSHHHTFIGNRTVDAWATPASLRNGPTSCSDPGDSSGYWFPSLFVGAATVEPYAAIVST